MSIKEEEEEEWLGTNRIVFWCFEWYKSA